MTGLRRESGRVPVDQALTITVSILHTRCKLPIPLKQREFADARRQCSKA